jgi:Sec-independent protein secretion pathway component TatC
VISQLLVAFPLLGLYEISIWVSGRVLRRKMREEALEN